MTTLLFIDFDHENERHAEIKLSSGCRLTVDRWVETNEDYLATGADVPEEWSDIQEFELASADDLHAFVTALTEELLDACFDFFDDMEQVDSDEARESIAATLAAYDEEAANPEGLSGEAALALVDELTSFPR